MAFKVPEKHRVKEGGNMATTALDGNNGLFLIPMSIKKGDNTKYNYYLSVIATAAQGWENVLITIMNKDGKLTPRSASLEEMDFIKAIFWGNDECVLQYFPATADDMKLPGFCVALWKPNFAAVPKPPKDFKGFSGKKTLSIVK